jgi:hypothetical protein
MLSFHFYWTGWMADPCSHRAGESCERRVVLEG